MSLVSTLKLQAGLRVLDEDDANVGKLGFAGVPESDRNEVMFPVQQVGGFFPAGNAYKVGYKEYEGTSSDTLVGRFEEFLQVRHGPDGRRLLSLYGVDDAQGLEAAGARRHCGLPVVVVENCADAVAVTGEQARQKSHQVNDDGLLAAIRCAEGP